MKNFILSMLLEGLWSNPAKRNVALTPIIFLFMILVVNATNAIALSCAFPDREESVKNSKDIFIGEIIEIISANPIENKNPWDAEIEVNVKLKVLEVIRGEAREYQDIKFSFLPKIKEKYLVFDNSAFSSMCSFSLSSRLEDAGWYFKVLNYESSTFNKTPKAKPPNADAPQSSEP